MVTVRYDETDLHLRYDEARQLPPATRERMDSYLWLRFFPSARLIEMERTPSAGEIRNAFEASGLQLAHATAVRQPFAADYTEYAEKIGRRGLSSLEAISDEEFRQGMKRLTRECQGRPREHSVREHIDLFVFRKPGPA
jgi:hypothetical protein